MSNSALQTQEGTPQRSDGADNGPNSPPPAYIPPQANFEYTGDIKEREPPSYDEEKGKSTARSGFVTILGKQYTKRKLIIVTASICAIVSLIIVAVLAGVFTAARMQDRRGANHFHDHQVPDTTQPTPPSSSSSLDSLGTTDTTTNNDNTNDIPCLTSDGGSGCAPIPTPPVTQENAAYWMSINKK